MTVAVDESTTVLVDTVDGEAIEVPTRAVMVRPDSAVAANPVWDIGALSDTEFSARQSMLTKGVQRIAELQRSILIEDKEGQGRNGDWGRLPGVDRAIIYKSGAEKLTAFYKLVPEFDVRREERTADSIIGLGTGRPNRITYSVHCKLHAGSIEGPTVGWGEGVCSSWEKRYLFRTGGRVCPSCGKATLRLGDKRGAPEGTKEWYCWKREGKSDGCGSRFAFDDPAISAGAAEVMNMEPWDLDNTLAKMATKRAHVDATLRTLGASALFTQDMEDNPPPPEEPEAPRRPAARASRSAPEPEFTPLVGSEVPADDHVEPPPKPHVAGLVQCESRSPFVEEGTEAPQCRREQNHPGAHRTESQSWA